MRKKIYRQIISFLLIIALLLTLTPGNLFLAQAASTPAWTHMSDAEAAAGYAAYTEATDTITFNATGDFSGRMKYVGIDDVSGKDYAIEFDMTVDGGALGVYNYEDSGELFGVYLDINANLLDNVHFQNGAFLHNFWSQDGNTTVGSGIVYCTNWNPAVDKTAAHIRVEYIRGAGGTLAGGVVNYYKKDSVTGKYLTLGSVAIPDNVADDPNSANHFGIQLWLGNGSVSNITVAEIQKESPVWEHMSDAEKDTGNAVYTQETDTITFKATGDFSGRMNYAGIDDVSGKDYAIEFDMTVDGGALGVYNYEDSGELFGVYLDINANLLDNVHFQNGAFLHNFWSQDGNTTAGSGIVYCTNWNPAVDKTVAHIRVEYVRGAGGTLAGGVVNYYKKDSVTGKYLTLGSVAIPDNVADDPNSANHFGIQLWLGNGSVCNITVAEMQQDSGGEDLEESSVWKYMSDAEADTKNAVYTQETDTITFKATGDFSGRMNYVGIDDVSDKDYAIEFDMTVDGGALGVYNYEDSGELFGVFLDINANLLDNVHFQNGAFLHNFWSQDGNTTVGSGIVYCTNWNPAVDMAAAHIRVEYIRGAGGTLAGGTVNYYKKDSATGEYLKLGSVAIPDNVADNPDSANHFGIQLWLGNGSVSNVTVTEFTADTEDKNPDDEETVWVHMNNDEKNVGTVAYDKSTGKMIFRVDGTMSSRMKYVGLADVSGKDYVVEFDLVAEGGLVGIFNYDDSGSLYGVYLDTNAAILDELHYTDWSTCADSFYFFESSNGLTTHSVVSAQGWDPGTDKAGAHLRVEFIRGKDGTLAGGTVNYYKKDSKTGNYVALGSIAIPDIVTDDPNMANYFGIQMWLGAGTISNITISEYAPAVVEKLPRWMHLNDTEKEVGDAVYYENSDTISFSGAHGWSSRLLNTEISDISGENYAVEFDANLGDTGAIGISALYEDALHFYNVYFNFSEFLLDGVGIMGQDSNGDAVIIDEFSYIDDSVYPHFSVQKLSPTRCEDVRIRIECFLGKNGTMAGGTAHFYFKRQGASDWVRLGVVKLPENISDDASVPNKLMIHGRETNGSISNISVIRNISKPVLQYNTSNSEQWGYVSDREKYIEAASFSDTTGKMTLCFNSAWDARMVCLTVPDVTGKAFALEFNAEFEVGGALGIVPFYEDENNWYGIYVDRGAKILDGVGYNEGNIIDDFNYVNATYYPYVSAQKTPIINQARIRFEYFPNKEGLASGAVCRIYYKQMPDGKVVDDNWRLIGEFTMPDTLVDHPEAANKIMISARLLCATLSDISYTEIDRDTETEYYNGPDEMAFEDGYPEDNYQPVAVEPEIPQKKTVPWWSIVMIVAGGGSLIGLLSCAVLVPAVKRKRQKKE